MSSPTQDRRCIGPFGHVDLRSISFISTTLNNISSYIIIACVAFVFCFSLPAHTQYNNLACSYSLMCLKFSHHTAFRIAGCPLRMHLHLPLKMPHKLFLSDPAGVLLLLVLPKGAGPLQNTFKVKEKNVRCTICVCLRKSMESETFPTRENMEVL